MSVEQNKATLHRIYDEVYNKGNTSLIPEVVSPDYHFADRKGHQGYSDVVATWRTAFPDIHFTVDEIVGEGDSLAYRLSAQGTFKGKFRGSEPTGREFKMPLAFFSQFENGKLLTSVGFGDNLGLYQQLGINPPAPQPAASAR